MFLENFKKIYEYNALKAHWTFQTHNKAYFYERFITTPS